MKRIIALLAVLVVLALVFVSCEVPTNGEDNSGDTDLNNEIINTDDTEISDDTDSDYENPDKEQNSGSDEKSANEGDDAESSDNSDDTDNSNNSDTSDTSDSSGNSSDSDNSGSGDSDNSSNNNTEEWIEPTVELQEPITVGDYKLALNAEGTEYTIVEYTGEDENLTIISEYEGIPVTRIGEQAFAGNYDIISISIPSPIRTIENSAFNSCFRVVSVELPDTLIYLDTQAFIYDDGIESLTVAQGNPRYHSVNNCIIETATKTLIKGCFNSVIPNDGSVEILGEMAFWGLDRMQNLIIPKYIKEIGNGAFYVCSTSLESIAVEEENPTYHSAGNCLIETATKTLLLGSNNSVIPTDGSVEIIANHAFYECTQLKSIHIPASVTTIGYGPFSNCSGIESITVDEENPVYSGEGNCIIERATKTIVLTCNNSVIPTDGSVTGLGYYAFGGRAITSLVIPECITSIGVGCFSSCEELLEVVVPDGITIIEDSTFAFSDSLTSVTLPASVTSVARMSFAFCGNDIVIKFKGTEEQWNAIEKGEDWDMSSNITVLFNQ